MWKKFTVNVSHKTGSLKVIVAYNVDIVYCRYVATTSCSVRQLAVIRQLALGAGTRRQLGCWGWQGWEHAAVISTIYTLDIYCRVSTL